MKYVIGLVCCLMSIPVFAQSQEGWEQVFREWMTMEEGKEDEDVETFELLESLAENKLNLNQVTREELEQLPFLSAQQVEGIIAYTDRYKPLRSMSELQMITALDRNTRYLLEFFVCVGEEEQPKRIWPSLDNVMKYGKNRLLATVKLPMYERKGDRNGYLGYHYRHDIRYQFTYGDRIKLGLTGAQDAGEPFAANKNRLGYDHYSFYFQLHKMGCLEELNLGMYRVQLGMGLVMNTGFHLGKLTMLQSLGRSSHVLTAHSSRSSQGFLQGAAATVRLMPQLKVTAFASYRSVDATLNDDGTVRTIVTDGYHRTPAELKKKNNTDVADLGARLSFRPSLKEGTASLNANIVYTHFDRPLVPYVATSSQLYRRYALQGSSFLNASLDYSYTNARLSFSGETALNGDGALAALHTLSYRLTDELSLMTLHRYYGLRYTAYHAQSFSEGGSVQNEHGLYVGVTWQYGRKWLLQGYADYTHFIGPRYQVSMASDAFETLLYARVYINRWMLEGRYRWHIRQRDGMNKTMLLNRYEHRSRLRATFTPTESWSLQTQADGVITSSHGERSRGVMVSQQATWQYRWLRLKAVVGWFRSDDYDSRLYQYEPSVLYDFSFPMYYGHGLRYAMVARAEIGSRLMVAAKIGTTDYFDRAVISSDLQQIDASSMTDVLLQLRYTF